MTGVPRRRDDVVFRPVGTEWVVYDPSANELHVLNVTSALVWELIDGARSPADVADQLAGLLRDTPGREELEKHVRDALSSFREKGLLR